jgi:hypothetical protein
MEFRVLAWSFVVFSVLVSVAIIYNNLFGYPE